VIAELGFLVPRTAVGLGPWGYTYIYIYVCTHIILCMVAFLLLPTYPVGVDDDTMDDLPMTFTFLHHPVHQQWPRVNTETELVMGLVDAANMMWDIFVLTSSPVGLHRREATDRRLVTVESLAEKDLERLKHASLMKLFRRSAGHTKPAAGRGRRGRGRGRGGARGRRPTRVADCDETSSCTSDEPDDPDELIVDTAPPPPVPSGLVEPSGLADPSASGHVHPLASGHANIVEPSVPSGSAASSSAASVSSHVSTPPMLIAAPSAISSSSSSSSAPCAVVKAAAPSGPSPAAAKAGPQAWYKAKANERVLEWWDARFPFVFILSNGIRTGYGVTCGCHANASGLYASTACKKSLTIGASGISQEEAALRLKRWLMLGKIGFASDPACARQTHVAIGGVHCRDLRSGVCGWSELDDDLDVLIATL